MHAQNYTFNATESTHTKGLCKLWALVGNEVSTVWVNKQMFNSMLVKREAVRVSTWQIIVPFHFARNLKFSLENKGYLNKF